MLIGMWKIGDFLDDVVCNSSAGVAGGSRSLCFEVVLDAKHQ